MHLGNVTFKSKQVEGVEGSAVANKLSLECFCKLTKTEYSAVERSLLVRELQTMAAGGVVESYAVPQSPTQAATRRDAVCKSLYERLFNLIVERINAALAAAGAPVAATTYLKYTSHHQAYFIGVCGGGGGVVSEAGAGVCLAVK
jgi:myosin-1